MVVSGRPLLHEVQALDRLPPAPPNAPNVLLIVLDTVRAKNLSLYGYERETTPQLDEFANTGVVFNHAISTSPWTLPSHSSMFTGRFPHEVSSDWLVPLDGSYPTLAEVLGEHGYRTGGFVANLLYCTAETGLSRGFSRYEEYPVSFRMVLLSSFLTRMIADQIRNLTGDPQDLVRKSAEQVNREFLAWLSDGEGRPFFAFLNYFDAHAPYLPPQPYATLFGSGEGRTHNIVGRRFWGPEKIQGEVDAYDGMLTYLDVQLDRLLTELKNRKILDNTLVIITSDHGELFGEHGLFDHGNSLYRPLLEVPLLISFPTKVPGGLRVEEPISLRDLPATVMKIIGQENHEEFHGSSLGRYWEKSGSQGRETTTRLLSEVSKGINLREWLPIMKGDMRSLVANGFHYIVNGDGREELYDFQNDREERLDLAGSEQGNRIITQMRAAIDRTRPENPTMN